MGKAGHANWSYFKVICITSVCVFSLDFAVKPLHADDGFVGWEAC